MLSKASDTLRNRCRNGRAWVLMGTSMCLMSLAVNAAPPSTAVDSSSYREFRSFVTGQTAVKYGLVEFKAGRSAPPQLFAFAYDSHVFFGREYCTNSHDLHALCLRDKICIRRGQEYWYYNGNPTSPLLYTGSYTPDDATAGAYGGFNYYFNVFAGAFQTFTLSDQGMRSLIESEGTFSVLNQLPRAKTAVTPSCTGRFALEQGVVRSAEVERRDGLGHAANQRVLFSYDGNSGVHGIPSSCLNEPSGFQVRVLSLTLLASDDRISDPPEFVPAALFTNKDISLVIHSNRNDYFVQPNGQLSSMDGRIPDREMADIKAGRKFFYMGSASLCVLGLILLWSRLNRSEPQTK